MEEIGEFVRKYISPPLARWVRAQGVELRYLYRLRKARSGYRQYSERYSEPLLFIAGLPKSGTSWLESMVASYPGYQHVAIPQAIHYELQHGGSHDFELPTDIFQRFNRTLAVLKLHVHGSAQNSYLLHESGIPYVVLYRDLRDVAVSHYFYVSRTPWHPEYEEYATRSVEDGLRYFGHTLLPDFVDWMQSWRKRRHPELSIELQYEDLLRNTEEEFRDVASHFELDSSRSTIQDIVSEHRFEKMSDGRSRGEHSEESFVRKGVAGDWENHFTPGLKRLFKEKAGELFIRLGYEDDYSW